MYQHPSQDLPANHDPDFQHSLYDEVPIQHINRGMIQIFANQGRKSLAFTVLGSLGFIGRESLWGNHSTCTARVVRMFAHSAVIHTQCCGLSQYASDSFSKMNCRRGCNAIIPLKTKSLISP